MNATRLFIASCLALIVTAMSFAIRGELLDPLGLQFGLNPEQMGWVAGTAFWGFTLAMIVGGPLCDVLGMGRLLVIAFVGHLAGVAMTIFATGFWTLFISTLLVGLANGFVEAACNPLIATMYPDRKTEKLNAFHVWFPGGIVIGGLVAYFFGRFELSWQWKMATLVLPTLIYGAMFLGQKFPKTERVESGVSTNQMFAACLRPLFIVLVLCMFLTAATELGTNQWLSSLLGKTAAVSGILVLVWINGIMAVGRQFAGPVVHRLSPTGILVMSAVLSAAGLIGFSYAHDRFTAFAAATIFALGICYFWPTMLGVTSERVPRSGALGLAIMGGAGMLSVSLILPFIGYVRSHNSDAAAFRYVAILPAILTVVFGILYARDKAKGGYRAERLDVDSTDRGFEPVNVHKSV